MKTNTSEKILNFIKQNKQFTANEIIKFTGFGATAIHRQLNKLLLQGEIEKTGKPPRVYYHLPINSKSNKIGSTKLFSVKIHAKEFGKVLSSRDLASRALLITIMNLDKTKIPLVSIEIDFSGVKVLGPGWADQFVSGLRSKYPELVTVLPTDNASVKESLEYISKF